MGMIVCKPAMFWVVLFFFFSMSTDGDILDDLLHGVEESSGEDVEAVPEEAAHTTRQAADSDERLEPRPVKTYKITSSPAIDKKAGRTPQSASNPNAHAAVRLLAGRRIAAAKIANSELAKTLQTYVRHINVHGATRAGAELFVQRRKRKRQGRTEVGQPKLKVRIRHRKVRGRGTYQCVSPQIRLQMAFDEDQGHRSLSRKFDLHHKTVVRNTMCVAETFLRRQDEWLKGVLDMARSGGIRPLCVCSCRKWDETKEKLTLETLTDATREAQTDCV